jgi:general secretion pathway protein K
MAASRRIPWPSGKTATAGRQALSRFLRQGWTVFPVEGSASEDRGFALLLVLWTMALLAFLAAQVTGAGRAETRVAAALRTGAQLQEAADAAVYETIWHMLNGAGDYWPPTAGVRVIREDAVPVVVTIFDQRGKLDVNQSPPALLQALFSLLGAGQEAAKTVANAIADWRSQQPAGTDNETPLASAYRMDGRAWGPAGQEFQRLDELQLVLGMTPALYAASLPYLTLGLEQGPWQSYASPVVLAAIAKAKHDSNLTVDFGDPRGPVVLLIEAHAAGAEGAAFTRRVLFRLDGSLSGPAWKYRILGWEDGE